jgi:hypothetical protein
MQELRIQLDRVYNSVNAQAYMIDGIKAELESYGWDVKILATITEKRETDGIGYWIDHTKAVGVQGELEYSWTDGLIRYRPGEDLLLHCDSHPYYAIRDALSAIMTRGGWGWRFSKLSQLRRALKVLGHTRPRYPRRLI